MPKIVPVGTPASTFDEPSSGSKTAMYREVSSMIVSKSYSGSAASSSTSTGKSSSSEAITPIFPVKRSASLSTSFVITSSFFCSSPCTFTAPCAPTIPVMCERATRLAIVLTAVWIDDISVSMSASSGFARHTSHMYRDSVTPV